MCASRLITLGTYMSDLQYIADTLTLYINMYELLQSLTGYSYSFFA